MYAQRVNLIARLRRRRGERDKGSVLILVLVMIVILSLITLPMLKYAMAVSSHNTVLTQKVSRQEAVKAGLRTALADPKRLYSYCAEESVNVAGPGVDGIPVSTTCDFLSFSQANSDEELHLGLAATRVGERIPAGLTATIQKDPSGHEMLDSSGNPLRYVYEPQTTDPHEWLIDTAPYSVQPNSEPRHIWSPMLPAHALSLRSPLGYQMPTTFDDINGNGVQDPGEATNPPCTAFFPGTYSNPIVLTGATYFASGVYYFENTVTVTAGADVVVGQGAHEGCTRDQDAAFYALPTAPKPHNISGFGATWVLGYDAQIIITNQTGSPKIQFNQRYVNDTDTGNLPSFGVSIVSVNGRLPIGSAANGSGQYTQTQDLLVPGINQVPLSLAMAAPDSSQPEVFTTVQAGLQNYRPSRLTHEPRPPTPPRGPTTTDVPVAEPLQTGNLNNSGAARITWRPPAVLGGQAITGYTVTASGGGGQFCTTTGALECVVKTLTSGTSYTFTVTATNSVGTSLPSLASVAVTPRKGNDASPSPFVGAPAAPATPTVVRHLDNTVVVSWTAPNANHSTITGYALTATPAIDFTATPCVFIEATKCIIRNLPVVAVLPVPIDYTFTVTATNEMGTSAASPVSGLIVPAVGASPANPPVVPPVVIPPYEPPPILLIDLPTTNPVWIDIPGYVSVPMGIVQVNNPNGLGTEASPVKVNGGILAAAFRVLDSRNVTGSLAVPIGLVNPVVQRTYKITSTTTSGLPRVTSSAVVQVNQNGAYAINSWVVQ